MQQLIVEKGEYRITTDKNKLDLAMIHDFLSNRSYWAQHIPFETFQRSVEHSLCFGVYHQNKQVGFARVISDFATIAYLGDVFILESYRGKGLSKWLMENIINYPGMQGLRRWILATADAHQLYEKYGFRSLGRPERFMEKHNPNPYQVPD
jgi:GNAT superfamily N-acetyltransferase